MKIINANFSFNTLPYRNSFGKTTEDQLQLKEYKPNQDEVIDYETSELKKRVEADARARFNRDLSLGTALINAYKEGEDPVKAIFEKYSRYKNDIVDSGMEKGKLDEELSDLDKAYDFAVERFSSYIHAVITFSGYKRDPNNPMTVIDAGVDGRVRKLMKDDIVEMLDTAKNHFDENNSLDGLTSEMLSSKSKTITYDDLKNLSACINEMTEYTKKLYEAEERNQIDEYIKESVEGLNLSYIAKGIFLDVFL